MQKAAEGRQTLWGLFYLWSCRQFKTEFVYHILEVMWTELKYFRWRPFFFFCFMSFFYKQSQEPRLSLTPAAPVSDPCAHCGRCLWWTGVGSLSGLTLTTHNLTKWQAPLREHPEALACSFFSVTNMRASAAFRLVLIKQWVTGWLAHLVRHSITPTLLFHLLLFALFHLPDIVIKFACILTLDLK